MMREIMREISLVALGIGVSNVTQAAYGTFLGDAPFAQHINKPSRVHEQTQAVESLNAQAIQGDANAQYRLGIVYRDGLGVQKCETTASEWFHKAARRGSVEATLALGLLYAEWEETEEALRWLEKAAQHGNPGAKHAYDYMLENDFGFGC